MASAFSRFRGDVEEDLEQQVARLSKEIAALRNSFTRRGSDAYEDARDTASGLYGDMRHRFVGTLPTMRKQAREAERVARDHPAATALVGLAVIGLLATMLIRR
jgi:ElaB/YqjD/DUF883 family membrane-anchored ribosome-binding protein